MSDLFLLVLWFLLVSGSDVSWTQWERWSVWGEWFGFFPVLVKLTLCSVFKSGKPSFAETKSVAVLDFENSSVQIASTECFPYWINNL